MPLFDGTRLKGLPCRHLGDKPKQGAPVFGHSPTWCSFWFPFKPTPKWVPSLKERQTQLNSSCLREIAFRGVPSTPQRFESLSRLPIYPLQDPEVPIPKPIQTRGHLTEYDTKITLKCLNFERRSITPAQYAQFVPVSKGTSEHSPLS